jgi:hypothetical protein
VLAATEGYENDLTYLWCHEFRSTAERACSRSIPHFFFTQTVIRNLDVPVQGQQNIIEFQISVDDAVLVEVLESEAYFCCIKSVLR